MYFAPQRNTIRKKEYQVFKCWNVGNLWKFYSAPQWMYSWEDFNYQFPWGVFFFPLQDSCLLHSVCVYIYSLYTHLYTDEQWSPWVYLFIICLYWIIQYMNLSLTYLHTYLSHPNPAEYKIRNFLCAPLLIGFCCSVELLHKPWGIYLV